MTVIPCGNDKQANPAEEIYEMRLDIKGKTIPKTNRDVGENSLKQIFLNRKAYWESIFSKHLNDEKQPSFSIYRKPINFGSFYQGNNYRKSIVFLTDLLVLHILFIKSNSKGLKMNYNAE